MTSQRCLPSTTNTLTRIKCHSRACPERARVSATRRFESPPEGILACHAGIVDRKHVRVCIHQKASPSLRHLQLSTDDGYVCLLSGNHPGLWFRRVRRSERLQTPPSTPDVKVVQRHVAAANPHSFALNAIAWRLTESIGDRDQKSADSF
jgi:hypothetical protein